MTEIAQDAVLVNSDPMDPEAVKVQGYDFNQGVDHDKLLESFLTTGFQATNFGLAVKEVERMLDWSLADDPIAEDEDDDLKDIEARKNVKAKIFLGYTSNMISSGVRETIRFLVQHKMVDVIVTTAGGIEEDFIKCMAETYIGDFSLPGRSLRRKGINRIGNLLVPNDVSMKWHLDATHDVQCQNYIKFEHWLMPILDTMVKEQKTREHDPQEITLFLLSTLIFHDQGECWSPSSMIHRLGKEIDNPDSVYYWAYKNNIPVFCPAITDGSIGDMIYFHSYKTPGLVLDIVADIRAINKSAQNARHTGMVIIGGGLRNGADHAVFINTAQEFDGSDAGLLVTIRARPDEAVSWGKIRMDASPVKVYGEASILFPLLVAQTFAKRHHRTRKDDASS
eukprot:gene9956-2133_t